MYTSSAFRVCLYLLEIYKNNLSKARVSQAGKIQEYLSGMRVIKSYNMQGSNFEKLRKACTDYRDICIKVEGGIGPLNLVAAAFLRSGLSLMTVTGVFLVAGGTLTVPRFALFLLVRIRVFDPLAVAIINYSELMMCSMAGERICTLLDHPALVRAPCCVCSPVSMIPLRKLLYRRSNNLCSSGLLYSHMELLLQRAFRLLLWS